MSRVEHHWVGARTGPLDQVASLLGEEVSDALDCRDLRAEQVPLALGEWSLVVLDSGTRHEHAGSGYNERRRECAKRAAPSVWPTRDAGEDQAHGLPDRCAAGLT